MPVKYTRRFTKQYAKLPTAIRSKVKKALGFLDTDFRHPGLRSHPVESAPGVFEAYVDDKYRMTFVRKSDIFVMRNVDTHDDCLRNP